ncbi:RNA polymerase sigma-70 factor (ECF subfamily) [Haloactinopolyspora alba]|uniref:RNA polymerase sigma-70 factor (ECF subfamily) n=1 Tax=Haloactinopolyspora alba TaxID=648780 RepID=A0A2P8EGD9_9ACTN|nr:RNA polymerase sigma-70 factor (ECF subfamily) [Haloactinopolyspora alba]
MTDAAVDVLAHRAMLLGLAYRLLGSAGDAEDVMQDVYLRWRDVDRDQVREPRRYLSRMVTRLALDRLRRRQAHEEYVGPWLPEPVATTVAPFDPLETVEQRDSVATATLLLLERLDPVERAVFVLRSAFDFPYAQIAEIVDRTPEHCRQLNLRARTRVADDRRRFTPSRREHAELLERFLAASRDGDLATLRTLLHDDVVSCSDGGGRVRSARHPIVGADRVARFFAATHHRHQPSAEFVEVNGAPAAVTVSPAGRHVITFAVSDGRISGLYVVANPDKLTHLNGDR